MKKGNTQRRGVGRKEAKKTYDGRISVKLIGVLLPSIILLISLLVGIIYKNTSEIVTRKSQDLLQKNTENVMHEVSAWKNETLTALETYRDTIQYMNWDAAQELAYIKHTANKYEAFPAGMYLAFDDGTLIHDSFVPGPDFDVHQKSWYNDGLVSEDFKLGEIYFDEDSQSYAVGTSGVLKNSAGQTRGVAAADVYLTAVSGIVNEVQIQQTGGMFLVDRTTGMIIGHKDEEMLGKLLGEETDEMYASVWSKIQESATGLFECKQDGKEMSLDIQNVDGANWTLVAYVPVSEVMADLNQVARISIVIAVLAIIILSAIMFVVVMKIITNPIKEIDRVARQIAEGNLEEKIHYQSNNELGELSDNFNRTVVRLQDYIDYIDEVAAVLAQLAEGNLKFELKYSYQGEFAKIKEALLYISSSLTDTITNIETSSVEVLTGAQQVAQTGQSLSSSTTEQASSVEELAATIAEVSQQVRASAEDAKAASAESLRTSDEIEKSNVKMQEMMEAIAEITRKSDEIGKIIKTIEDIAFQTNILALNAAVEAARAGEAGKGFAVVADEVRNLASKSADAAKNTTVLIEETVEAVGNGTEIATIAAEAMTAIVENSKRVTEFVNGIADSAERQSVSMAEIASGIEQMSGRVQSDAATAEESSAASEELSKQARVLDKLVEKFRK